MSAVSPNSSVPQTTTGFLAFKLQDYVDSESFTDIFTQFQRKHGASMPNCEFHQAIFSDDSGSDFYFSPDSVVQDLLAPRVVTRGDKLSDSESLIKSAFNNIGISVNFTPSRLDVIIDYLSLVITLESILSYYWDKVRDSVSGDESQKDYLSMDHDYLVKRFLDDFLAFIPDANIHLNDYGWLNYKKSGSIYRNFTHSGKFAYGGNGDGLLLSLSGAGCSLVDFKDVYQFLKKFDVKITRYDFAHDVFNNDDAEFKEWKEGALSGLFDSRRGKNPTVQHISNTSGKGDTVTIGNLANGKCIQFYEKGRQLGNSSSGWYRCEVRYRNKDRVLPLEAILRPDIYFLAAHEALLKFEGSSVDDGLNLDDFRIRAVKEKVKIVFLSMMANAKTQVGKLIYTAKYAAGWTNDQIVDFLMVEGTPKRLIANSF